MMIPERIQALRSVSIGLRQGLTSVTHNATRSASLRTCGRSSNVSLKCSIDGYGPVNEYIRRPSRWHALDRNLRTLDANFRAWNLRQVSTNTTVQIYNVLDLDKLYAYLRSGFEHILPAPSLSPLSWPAYQSVQNLPPNIKKLARERLVNEKTREEYRNRDDLTWVLSSIDTLLAYMDRPVAKKHWKDFRTFTTRSDREFGDSFERAAPEMTALLAQTGLWNA